MKPQYSKRVAREHCIGKTLAVIHIRRQIVIAIAINYNDTVLNGFNHSVYEHAVRVSS